jgi:hypothetical protein
MQPGPGIPEITGGVLSILIVSFFGGSRFPGIVSGEAGERRVTLGGQRNSRDASVHAAAARLGTGHSELDLFDAGAAGFVVGGAQCDGDVCIVRTVRVGSRRAQQR